MNAQQTKPFRLLRSFARDRDGATAVEFAFILPPFLFLLMAIFQIGLAFTAGQVMEDATTEFARLIRTGQAQGVSMTQQKFRDEFCKRIAVFLPCSDNNLLIDIQVLPGFGSVDLSWPVDKDGKLKNQGQYMLGQAGDTILIRTFYQYPIKLPFMGGLSNLPDGSRLLAASAAFRNEPFGMSSSAGVGS